MTPTPQPAQLGIGPHADALLIAIQNNALDWRKMAARYSVSRQLIYRWWCGEELLPRELALRILTDFQLIQRPNGATAPVTSPTPKSYDKPRLKPANPNHVTLTAAERTAVITHLSDVGLTVDGLARLLKVAARLLDERLNGAAMPVGFKSMLLYECGVGGTIGTKFETEMPG